MSRPVEVVVKIAVLAIVALVLARAAGWVRLKMRPDPAAKVSGVRFEVRPGASPDQNLAILLEAVRAKHKLPALAAAVIKGGNVAAQAAVGVRIAGGSEPVTIDDRFHLGSDTKAMTATLIAVLIEEGKLSWSTTVGEVFGESNLLSAPAHMDAGWRPVTIEQLLRNRGGAPADLNAGGLWGRLWEQKGTHAEQRRQLVAGVIEKPPAAEPGTRFIYSNAGFAIAGAMAEQVTGGAWEDLMQEKVFTPLGITSAGFGAPGDPSTKDQPRGHRPNGSPVEPGPQADNPPAIGPAGTAHMTIGDWAKFITAHLRGDPLNPARQAALVAPAMYEMLHRPIDNYAMGWGVMDRSWAKGPRPTDRGIVLSHAGSNTMWFCVAWLAPERDFAVVIATNQGGPQAEKGADEAAGVLIRSYNK